MSAQHHPGKLGFGSELHVTGHASGTGAQSRTSAGTAPGRSVRGPMLMA